ncbi:phosphatidylserine decarboxylase family protein [Desulforhopalus singaporensis]|uniref:Phosphatidylserine decarboxylase proenzyme n=1 Tax=Desulforhopalus singaporensis TaxID=91360 RepID=A0A1H0MP15_9BACT|nr:phosphatidylserine decarboxylase family protein [Desulforhopalus singaporensis]SDO82189.1 phosphatidylserine decarboxylase [Desulforhopalus singaporensis]
MLTPQVPVAREGYPFIGLAAFITLLLAVCGYPVLTAIAFLVSLFVLAFFRDPERFVPPDDDALVSPADGKVISVEETEDAVFTKHRVCKISIFMNVFNVHVNRIPFDGKVESVLYRPGKFYSADSPKGGLENEYCGTVITTSAGQKLAFVQIAGLIARRIVCWLEPGDVIVKGRRFGLIRFGSRVDLYLPADTAIQVAVGDKVRAGETVIGVLKK